MSFSTLQSDLLKASNANNIEGIKKAEQALMAKIDRINRGGGREIPAFNKKDVIVERKKVVDRKSILTSDAPFLKKELTEEEMLYKKFALLKITLDEMRTFQHEDVEANDVANYQQYSTVRFDLKNPNKLYNLPEVLEVIVLISYKEENEKLHVTMKLVNLYEGKLEEKEFQPIVQKILSFLQYEIEKYIEENEEFKENYEFHV